MSKEEVKEVEPVEVVQEVKEQVQVDNRKGLSIASMILGICSIVFCSQFIIAVACRSTCYSFWVKR